MSERCSQLPGSGKLLRLAESLLTFRQRSLCMTAVRNVPSHFRRAYDAPVRILHRRNSKRQFDPLAVLTAAHGFEMLQGLATADAIDNDLLFVTALRRDNKRDVLTDCLRRRVTEKALRAVVPASNDPTQVLADDGVVRGFYDRSQTPACVLRFFCLCNINVHASHLDRFPEFILKDLPSGGNPPDTSVWANDSPFRFHRRAGAEAHRNLFQSVRPVLRVNQLLPSFVRARERSWCETMHRFCFPRPRGPVGLGMPIERPNPGRLVR